MKVLWGGILNRCLKHLQPWNKSSPVLPHAPSLTHSCLPHLCPLLSWGPLGQRTSGLQRSRVTSVPSPQSWEALRSRELGPLMGPAGWPPSHPTAGCSLLLLPLPTPPPNTHLPPMARPWDPGHQAKESPLFVLHSLWPVFQS